MATGPLPMSPVTVEATLVEGIMEELRNNGVIDDNNPRFISLTSLSTKLKFRQTLNIEFCYLIIAQMIYSLQANLWPFM